MDGATVVPVLALKRDLRGTISFQVPPPPQMSVDEALSPQQPQVKRRRVMELLRECGNMQPVYPSLALDWFFFLLSAGPFQGERAKAGVAGPGLVWQPPNDLPASNRPWAHEGV